MKLLPLSLPPVTAMDRLPLSLPFSPTDLLWRYPLGFPAASSQPPPVSPLLDFKTHLPTSLGGSFPLWRCLSLSVLCTWRWFVTNLWFLWFIGLLKNVKTYCEQKKWQLSFAAQTVNCNQTFLWMESKWLEIFQLDTWEMLNQLLMILPVFIFIHMHDETYSKAFVHPGYKHSYIVQ